MTFIVSHWTAAPDSELVGETDELSVAIQWAAEVIEFAGTERRTVHLDEGSQGPHEQVCVYEAHAGDRPVPVFQGDPAESPWMSVVGSACPRCGRPRGTVWREAKTGDFYLVEPGGSMGNVSFLGDAPMGYYCMCRD